VSRPSQTAHLLVFNAEAPLAIPKRKVGVPMMLHRNRNCDFYAPDYTLYSVQNRNNKLQ
jgi:hypothetical protein